MGAGGPPPGAPAGSASLLLARVSSPGQEAFIGNQAGGRVFLFLGSGPITGNDPERARRRDGPGGVASSVTMRQASLPPSS